MKKRTKKTFWTLWLVAVLMLSLTACSGKSQSGSSDDIVLKPFKTDATIQETVLWDEHDVKITALELNYTEDSADVKLKLENNSDKELSFYCATWGCCYNAINGYMCDDGYLNEDIGAGETLEESVCFDTEELRMMGIMEIADIQLGFGIADEDYNYFYSGPKQIKTSIFGKYNYKKDTYLEVMENGAFEKRYQCTIDYLTKEKLYEQLGVSVISAALFTDEDGEQEFMIEAINDNEEQIYTRISEIYINDVEVEDSNNWSTDSVNSGCRRVVGLRLDLLLDDDEAPDIGGEIEKITFHLSILDSTGKEVGKKEQISITIPNKK